MNRIELLNELEALLRDADELKNAYTWRPPSTAGARRAMERRYNHPVIEWDWDGHVYTASLSVACSCAHVYVNRYYTRDGDKCDVRVVRNVFKKMYAETYEFNRYG